MTRKYGNHTPQTNPRHREEEPQGYTALNIHEVGPPPLFVGRAYTLQ